MSRYAFDLDGTLDNPAVATLARDLHAAGHEIHIVTGMPYDQGEWTLRAREEKLCDLRVPYTAIHRCGHGPDVPVMGAEKARVCRDLGVVMMFEDLAGYIREIGPTTPCCYVVNSPETFGRRPLL